MFTYYKYYNREKNVKDASKEDERDISIHPRIIYFFSHFTIYNPYVAKKFSPSPLGYSVGVILPLGQLESFITRDSITAISFTVYRNHIYRTFELKEGLHSQLPHINELYIDISFYLP